jgi:hypothetical protein
MTARLRYARHARQLAALGAALALGLLPAAQSALAADGGAHPAHPAHLAHPAPHGRFGVFPATGAGHAVPTRRRNPGPLYYNGGPVQHHPVVYLDFWGSQWNHDTNGIPQYMTNLFDGLGTAQDTWSVLTSQYTDSSGSGPTFNGPVLAGSWSDNASPAPATTSQSDIAAEADNAAAHFGVTGDPDAQIVVMSPSGSSADSWLSAGFCAYHDYDGNVSYTNMPYQLDAPAGSRCPNAALGGKLDAFSIVEGHEYAESITDPQPASGWVASSGSELGDLCESNFQPVKLPTGTFAMQPLWSNRANGCVIS